MNNRQSQPITEHPVVREAKSLLEEIRFSESRGAYLRGDSVTLIVDPRYNQDLHTIRVLVTLIPSGLQQVDWPGLALKAQKQEGLYQISFLNQRGQALFPSLSPGDYSLTLNDPGELLGEIIELIASQAPQIQGMEYPVAENICRSFLQITSTPKIPEVRRRQALDALIQLSGFSEMIAKPALDSCLEILLEPSMPVDMRLQASKAIPREKRGWLVDLDLRRYSEKISKSEELKQEAEFDVEKSIFQGFGFILAQRDLKREDDQSMLAALVNRDREIGAYLRTRGVQPQESQPTRGAVRTRGRAVRTRGAARLESPLITLARSGGRRVRDYLVKILSKESGQDALIQQLNKISFKE